ncbi:MAG: PIN domain-containing protein [Planctomycetes bacterium]|nr:PIN domain-containing protein [Planctomycetota bacterium]
MKCASIVTTLTTVICCVQLGEFCSALAIKTGAGQIEVRSARRLLSLFRLRLEQSRYRIVAVGREEYVLACHWLAQFSTPLRTVDALHLAVAFPSGLRLLTADEGPARSARHFGVEHELIS